MTLTLAAGSTLRGVATAATSVTITVFGDELSTVDTFKKLHQGQLPNSVGTLYTVGSVTHIIKSMILANTTASSVTATIYIDGQTDAFSIGSIVIPANGEAIWANDGWKVLDAASALLTSSSTSVPTARLVSTTAPISGGGALSADLTLALNTDGVDNTFLANMTQGTIKGRAAAAGTGDPTDLTAAQVKTILAVTSSDISDFTEASQDVIGALLVDSTTIDFTYNDAGNAETVAVITSPVSQVPVGVSRTINTTAPLTGGGDLSGDRTIAIPAASVSAAGSMSAIDKSKLDNLWVDVTANTIALVLVANTGAQNITALNAILSGAPNGSTIYFPPGTYLFNAAWTMPNKMFSFLGRGSNRAGSPATAFTELRWNANVGASLIVLPGSGNGWYTTFRNLTFTTTVDQTVGTLVDANGNVGINFDECAVQSAGGFFNDVLTYGGGAGSNSGNSTSINGCNVQGFKGNGVLVNAAGSSLAITDSVIQGQWGTTAQAATSCIRGKWVGALQVLGCDVLGGTNNVLLDPTAASSEVCASVQFTNTYFDSSFGSSFKVAGTGATVRGKFDTCTFTTNAGGTAFSAIELAGTNVYAAGGQDLAFVNCNIYNTFGTTGATNGVLITNVADVSFTNCKVAGWATGYNITPMASNKTNVQIIGGTVGPSGGYGANTLGFNIVAGAYKGLQIRGVNAINNTTNLTLGAVTVNAGEGSLFAITDCPGINPKGSVTTPGVPTAGTTVTNTTGFRVLTVSKNGATAPAGIVINGVATTAGLINEQNFITLEPGGTIAFTTTTVGSWVWVGQ